MVGAVKYILVFEYHRLGVMLAWLFFLLGLGFVFAIFRLAAWWRAFEVVEIERLYVEILHSISLLDALLILIGLNFIINNNLAWTRIRWNHLTVLNFTLNPAQRLCDFNILFFGCSLFSFGVLVRVLNILMILGDNQQILPRVPGRRKIHGNRLWMDFPHAFIFFNQLLLVEHFLVKFIHYVFVIML